MVVVLPEIVLVEKVESVEEGGSVVEEGSGVLLAITLAAVRSAVDTARRGYVIARCDIEYQGGSRASNC